MKPVRTTLLILLMACLAACSPTISDVGPAATELVLPSWNDGAAKQAIVDFVSRVSDQASPDFVPEPQRIAVFDNDGTLWPGNPLPFQLAFVMDELRRRAPTNPSWPPWRATSPPSWPASITTACCRSSRSPTPG